MVKTKVQELMYAISEILYRNGKYGMERIAIICETLSESMKILKWNKDINSNQNYIDSVFYQVCSKIKTNNYLLDKDEKQIIKLFKVLIKKDKLEIANAIKQLIDNNRKTSNIISTDDFSVKIMQIFAKKICKGDIFIDPCVGTGKLLAGLYADKYYGFDIDINAQKISEAYINLVERNIDRTKLDIRIYPENFLYKTFGLIDNIYNPTYIFDPPLNDPIEMNPFFENYLNKADIYPFNKNIPSEYAFLLKILSDTDINESNFVCIFPNNFLFTNDKFKSSFRKYLIENSIIAIIQSNFSPYTKVQRLILVGKSKLDNSPERPIYFITPKNENINYTDITQIAQKCIHFEQIEENEFYDIAKIKTYSLQALREMNYQVSMPQYYENEINPKDIKSLDEIEENLVSSVGKLYEANQKLDELLRNLRQGINQSLNVNEAEPYVGVLESWFFNDETDIAGALKDFTDIEQPWTKLKLELYINELPTKIKRLKTLYDNNRIRIKDNKLEIYSSKNKPRYKNVEPFSTNLIVQNENDSFIKSVFESLSEKQKQIFNAFIKFQFDNENSFENFTTSELHSAIATFKVLGLLYTIPNIENKIERYFPYIPILNIQEDN